MASKNVLNYIFFSIILRSLLLPCINYGEHSIRVTLKEAPIRSWRSDIVCPCIKSCDNYRGLRNMPNSDVFVTWCYLQIFSATLSSFSSGSSSTVLHMWLNSVKFRSSARKQPILCDEVLTTQMRKCKVLHFSSLSVVKERKVIYMDLVMKNECCSWESSMFETCLSMLELGKLCEVYTTEKVNFFDMFCTS